MENDNHRAGDVDDDLKSRMLQEGPIGRWCTWTGSADALGIEEVRFSGNGTGLITSRSAFSGVDETRFNWEMAGHGLLRLQLILLDDQPIDGEVDDEPFWQEIPLEFRVESSDFGDMNVLSERGSVSFADLIGPLRYLGETAV